MSSKSAGGEAAKGKTATGAGGAGGAVTHTETPGQSTGRREDFDAKIDVATVIPALARHINTLLERFLPKKPTVDHGSKSYSLERAHEEGYWEVTDSLGEVTHVPMSSASIESVLNQLIAK